MASHSHEGPGAAKRAALGALVMVGLIIAFYLLREHWGHVAGSWPYLLLLACPAMHLFMHGHHDHSHHESPPKPPAETTRAP